MIFEACLNYLPAAQARVFMMREYLGLRMKFVIMRIFLQQIYIRYCIERGYSYKIAYRKIILMVRKQDELLKSD